MTPTDRHRSSADTINPQQNETHEDPNETESVNIEHALVGEPSAHIENINLRQLMMSICTYPVHESQKVQ